MSEHISKQCTCADIKICPKNDQSGIVISAELPGVKKKDIELDIASNSFCVAGERNDLKYDCCYHLPWDVDPEKSDAHFDNGLLTVSVPFKQPIRGERIKIH